MRSLSRKCCSGRMGDLQYSSVLILFGSDLCGVTVYSDFFLRHFSCLLLLYAGTSLIPAKKLKMIVFSSHIIMNTFLCVNMCVYACVCVCVCMYVCVCVCVCMYVCMYVLCMYYHPSFIVSPSISNASMLYLDIWL